MSNKNQLIETFTELVKIDSPTEEEKQVSDFIKQLIEKMGFSVYQDERFNLLVEVEGKGEPILLDAHLDTVEPGRGIEPILENGILRSKGETILGADNKAIVAIYLQLLRWLKDEKPATRPLEILLTIGEERGEMGVATFDHSKLKSKLGLCFDAAFPVGTILLSSPYYLSQGIEIVGKEADASTAEKGQSVVPALAEFLTDFPQGVVEDGVFSNIGILNGGQAQNAVLSHVSIRAEVRAFQEEAIDRYKKLIENKLQEAVQKHNCQAKYNGVKENPGYVIKKDDTYVEQLKNVLQATLADRQVDLVEQYWGIADANWLNEKGIKTLNLGYGVKDPHTVREQISVKDMMDVLQFLQKFITS